MSRMGDCLTYIYMMKSWLKKHIKESSLYAFWQAQAVKRQRAREIAEWARQGRPVPPPHEIKQKAIRYYAKKFRLKVFVETGTYYGAMVEAVKNDFDTLYSIELSRDLYEKACERFKGQKAITLIQGDSGVEIGAVMKRLKQPALFWLDGHYSEGVTARGDRDTPILAELTHILNAKEPGHVILIDDARCFGRDADYPSIQELTDFVRKINPAISIHVEDDSIRLLPKR